MVASGGTNLSGPVEMSRSFVAPGSPGPQGGPGEKGEKGDPGDQGVQGPRGFTGDKGDKGDKGDQGTQGIQGPLGIQGSKGDKGDQGIQGVKGDTGAQGIQGIQGVKGDKGDTGAQGPSGAPAPVTRSAAYCFELCQQAFNMSAATPNHLRRPFKLGIKPTRFRVRVRNRIQLSDSSPTGTEIGKIANLNIVIGRAGVDSTTGDLNGNYTAAPYEIQTTTDVATGTELVSGWVDAATYSINVDEIHLLGYSFNSGNVSNSQVGLNGGFSFRDSTPSNLKVVAPSTAMTRSDNAAFLQVIIEYEHQDNDARHMLVIGNSLSGPSANSGATPFPVTNVGEMGTWHQIWAQNQRCAATSIAVAGAYASHYSSASGRWNLFDGFNIPYVPDVVMCFAAASSDVADCTSSGTMDAIKTNVRNVIKYARTKYASATRVYWTNVPPRNNFSGSGATSTTNEYWRKHFNVWIHNTLPTLINGCFDLDSLLSDWADPARLRDVFTTEGVHWTVRAHQIATRILPFRRGM